MLPCQVPPEFMPHLPLLKSLGTRDAPSPQDLLGLLASLHKPHATQPLTSVQLRCVGTALLPCVSICRPSNVCITAFCCRMHLSSLFCILAVLGVKGDPAALILPLSLVSTVERSLAQVVALPAGVSSTC